MRRSGIVAPSEEYLAQADPALSDEFVIIAAEQILAETEEYKKINQSRIIRVAKAVGNYIIGAGPGIVGLAVPIEYPDPRNRDIGPSI
jgi:hypothetical protein